MVYYIATCTVCTPRLPIPFADQRSRDIWAQQHMVANWHRVEKSEDER